MKDSTKREHELPEVPKLRNVPKSRGETFARRRHVARGAWHETVTHYMPEPWLLALERERIGLPFRPGHRPGASI